MCSGRTEKPVPCSGDSGKRGPEVDGRDHPKDDQRKCSGIKHCTKISKADRVIQRILLQERNRQKRNGPGIRTAGRND